MNTIEQAREVSVMLRSWRSAHSDGAADTVDALVAELVALKAQEPVAWMQSKPHEGDCIPGSEYLVMTDGWKKYLSKNPNNTDFVSSHDRPLYLAAGAQPVQQVQEDKRAQLFGMQPPAYCVAGAQEPKP